jgi:hypothetical protein
MVMCATAVSNSLIPLLTQHARTAVIAMMHISMTVRGRAVPHIRCPVAALSVQKAKIDAANRLHEGTLCNRGMRIIGATTSGTRAYTKLVMRIGSPSRSML